MGRMTPKNFDRLIQRDVCCVHCGETEALSPNHRINRGMGGSKALERSSNLVLLCSEMNTLIESNWFLADLAKFYGWKLERWEVPEETPYFDSRLWKWFLIDNDYNRTEITDWQRPRELPKQP